MRRGVLVHDFANQHDAQAYDQFRHGARVGVGRVEDCYAVRGRGLEVYLINAYAETADVQKLLRRRYNI